MSNGVEEDQDAEILDDCSVSIGKETVTEFCEHCECVHAKDRALRDIENLRVDIGALRDLTKDLLRQRGFINRVVDTVEEGQTLSARILRAFALKDGSKFEEILKNLESYNEAVDRLSKSIEDHTLGFQKTGRVVFKINPSTGAWEKVRIETE